MHKVVNNMVYNPSKMAIFPASSISTVSIDRAEKVPIFMALMNRNGYIAFLLWRGRSMALIEALVCHL